MAAFDQGVCRLGASALPVCERYEIAVVREAALHDPSGAIADANRFLVGVGRLPDGQTELLGLWPASDVPDQTWKLLWTELLDRGLMAVRQVIYVDIAGVARAGAVGYSPGATISRQEVSMPLVAEPGSRRHPATNPGGKVMALSRRSAQAERDFAHVLGRGRIQRLLCMTEQVVAGVARAYRRAPGLDRASGLESLARSEFLRLSWRCPPTLRRIEPLALERLGRSTLLMRPPSCKAH